MTPRARAVCRSFADVYDALYDNPIFIARRTDFILAALGASDGLLLDAGCGTGRQIDELQARGCEVIGLDLERQMLTIARRGGIAAPLICGDLRRLPFRAAFTGALCLESPLAYLLDDDEFIVALRSLRRALVPQGWLIMDTYDYAGTFWPESMGRMRAEIGPVRIVESHSYDEQTRLWTMRQRFAMDDEGRTRRFQVTHALKMRTPNEYAAALEQSGFEVREMLDGYPNLPEKRIVVVAVAR
jgi:SAM-dependent methyltransferase